MNNPEFLDGTDPFPPQGDCGDEQYVNYLSPLEFEASIWSRVESGKYASYEEAVREELTLLWQALYCNEVDEREVAEFKDTVTSLGYDIDSIVSSD